jgi:hypothetical protein
MMAGAAVLATASALFGMAAPAGAATTHPAAAQFGVVWLSDNYNSFGGLYEAGILYSSTQAQTGLSRQGCDNGWCTWQDANGDCLMWYSSTNEVQPVPCISGKVSQQWKEDVFSNGDAFLNEYANQWFTNNQPCTSGDAPGLTTPGDYESVFMKCPNNDGQTVFSANQLWVQG